MRSVVLFVLLAAACSEKREAPPPAVVKPAGPPPSCVELERLLEHLEKCADQEDSSYVDILMTKSSLRMQLDRDPSQLGPFCTERARAFRVSFPRCATAEAQGSAPPPRPAPIESVPLDPSVLGSTPAPFGRLSFLRAGMTRDQVLDELGLRAPRGGSIPVELGILGFGARVDIDFANTFDVVKITVPNGLHEVLAKAWGPATRASTWIDPAKHWRADLSTELMIGPYVPFDSLLGDGPDGLAAATTLIGLTPTQVRLQHGSRFNGREILMPATDVCAYYTKLYVDFDERTNLVAKLRFEQCYDDGEQARLVLESMNKHWGKATPLERAGKPDVITFARPGRSLEVSFEARLVTTITATAER